MDIKTKISTISELRVSEEFVRRGFTVFTQINGKAPFDLVVFGDGKLWKVSVKSVLKPRRSNIYKVQLRRIRSNKTKNNVYHFNSSDAEILGVYLNDINKVLLVESHSIKQINELCINLENLNNIILYNGGLA